MGSRRRYSEYEIEVIRINGLRVDFFQEWSYTASEEFEVTEAITLDYDNTAFPFSVLAFNLILALLLSIMERARVLEI